MSHSQLVSALGRSVSSATLNESRSKVLALYRAFLREVTTMIEKYNSIILKKRFRKKRYFFFFFLPSFLFFLFFFIFGAYHSILQRSYNDSA